MEGCRARGMIGDICRGTGTCVWKDHLTAEIGRGDDMSIYNAPGAINSYGGCIKQRECQRLINDNTPKKPTRRARKGK